MKFRWLFFLLLCAILMPGRAAFAEAASEPTGGITIEADDPATPTSDKTLEELSRLVEEPVPIQTGDGQRMPLISLSARIDTQFSAGSPSGQGFSVPSLRFAAAGQLEDFVDYRVALGQTREFSTALLPQMMPVEAFINLFSGKPGLLSALPQLSWKFGMFTPQFDPNWTPDLSDLDLPDYNLTHKALFIARDLGTQLLYQSSPHGFSTGAGAFNGNGIFSINSNNSKAFVAFIKQEIAVDDSTVAFGASGYSLSQAARGALNYKSNWVGNLFCAIYWRTLRLHLSGDVFIGGFEGNDFGNYPLGGSFVMTLGFSEWLRFFLRLESMNATPDNSAPYLRHYQLGPTIDLGDSLHVFMFYDYLDQGNASPENSAQVRLRLVI